MNVGDKIYNKFVGIKLSEGQYDLLNRTFCKGKNDKLSQNLRNWIFEQIQEMPANTIEYSLTQREGENRTGVILFYEDGSECDIGFFDSKEDAMKQIPLNAKERR